MREDPMIAYQDWLDANGDAVLTGDMDKIAEQVSLPYLHTSLDSRMVIETRKHMEEGFTSFGNYLRAHGINQFIRLCSSAEYLSDDYIEGFHVTHVMRNAQSVVEPYSNRSVLRRAGSGWKLTECFNGFYHAKWPVNAIKVPQDWKIAGAFDSDDARREAAQPLSIYQSFLNELTHANVSGNFEAYCAKCSFPYTSHADEDDMILAGPDDVWPFFETVAHLLSEYGVEDFLRIADHAEFVSGDTIYGYHTTRFLRDGQDALGPIKSRMVLKREGHKWFLKSVTNAIKQNLMTRATPSNTADLVTRLEIHERTKQ